MKTVQYQIPNISCGHCVQTIQMEVSDLEGVIRVEADATSKEVKIEFDAPASEEQILALLTEIHYAPA